MTTTTVFDPQPGDTVVIRDGGWRPNATIATVARVTKTQIVVTIPGHHADRRFRRQDMREVGTYSAELLDPASDTGRRLVNRKRADDALHRLRGRTDLLCKGLVPVTVAELDDLQAALDALRAAHAQLAQDANA